MFKEIISISKNYALVRFEGVAEEDLLNLNLVFEDTNKKILEFDFTDFPYLALWSKKGAPFVCIEPWQNTADKIDSNQIYKEKENILSLEPDEIYSCKYIVKFY